MKCTFCRQLTTGGRYVCDGCATLPNVADIAHETRMEVRSLKAEIAALREELRAIRPSGSIRRVNLEENKDDE